jgi:hypothetical protein
VRDEGHADHEEQSQQCRLGGEHGREHRGCVAPLDPGGQAGGGDHDGEPQRHEDQHRDGLTAGIRGGQR